ncbi:MAG: permease [Cyanobacteriota bacterium]|jgi:uncharacterized membrane protein YraQ (UPF0718 family)
MPPLSPETLTLALTCFVSYLCVTLPSLLLGTLISSLLLVWTDRQRWIGRLPQNRLLGSLLGAGLGILFPLGGVGAAPVARRLLRQGAPLPVVAAFWVAAPTLNWAAVVLTLTFLAGQPKLIFLRIALTWIAALLAGLWFSLYGESPTRLLREPRVKAEDTEVDPLHQSGNLHYGSEFAPLSQRSLGEKLRLSVQALGDEFLELAGIVVLTSALAALIAVFFPLAQALTWAVTPSQQVFLMLGLGAVFPLNGIFNVSFLVPYLETLWSGALLGFLLLGAWVNLQTLGLGLALLRGRAWLYGAILLTQFSLLAALGLNHHWG